MAKLIYTITTSLRELFQNFHRLPADAQQSAFEALIDSIIEGFVATGSVPQTIDDCTVNMATSDQNAANEAINALTPRLEKKKEYAITWKIPSRSRSGLVHTVTYDLDKDDFSCSCEQFQFRGVPCAHIAVVRQVPVPSGIEIR